MTIPVSVLLAALLLCAAHAQEDEAPPEFLAACGAYFDANGAMLEGCAFMGEDGLLLAAPTCSFGCSQFWAGMDAGCRAYLQGNPLIQDEAGQVLSVEQIDALCKDVAAPDLPALTFECNVTDGYSWLNLIMAATAMSPTGNVEGAPADVEVGDPAVALASNCNTLGTAADPTGCCTQTAPTESPWVEYDLGGSYEVAGVEMSAPTGNCSDGPCVRRTVLMHLFVTPTSVAATQASDGFKGYMDSVNQVQTADPATLPPGAPLLVEGDANALLMRWHTTQLALERAQCAAVTSDMLYAEGYEGQLRGGGMFGVQCGEGPAAQNRGEPSTGRYLLLARTPGDGGDLGAAYQPSLLAFCGPFRVCARPAVRR